MIGGVVATMMDALIGGALCSERDVIGAMVLVLGSVTGVARICDWGAKIRNWSVKICNWEPILQLFSFSSSG